MNKTIVLLDAAHQGEAEDAALCYEAQRVGLGTDFLKELQRILDVIAGQPDRDPSNWQSRP